jgi:uncharacterized protein YjiS (DUF1127 family)
MPETALHPITFVSRAALRFARFAARLVSAFYWAMMVRATRRALDELHDDALRDVGLTRGDILFVVDALVSGRGHITRNELDHLGDGAAGRREMRFV